MVSESTEQSILDMLTMLAEETGNDAVKNNFKHAIDYLMTIQGFGATTTPGLGVNLINGIRKGSKVNANGISKICNSGLVNNFTPDTKATAVKILKFLRIRALIDRECESLADKLSYHKGVSNEEIALEILQKYRNNYASENPRLAFSNGLKLLAACFGKSNMEMGKLFNYSKTSYSMIINGTIPNGWRPKIELSEFWKGKDIAILDVVKELYDITSQAAALKASTGRVASATNSLELKTVERV